MKGALDTYKLNEGILAYSDNMKSNLDDKLKFFWSKIDWILSNITKRTKINVLDVGCCSWTLVKWINDQFWSDVNVSWVDISKEMIEIALKNNSWNCYIDNWYTLAKTWTNTQDIITYSSILHELWSYFDLEGNYNEESYMKWIEVALISANRVLKDGGYLLIKDPVKPLNPKDELVMKTKWITERILTVDNLPVSLNDYSVHDLVLLWKELDVPNNLDYISRVLLFLSWFDWAPRLTKNLDPLMWDGEMLKLSRELTSEVARHVPLWYSKWDFVDEQKEWYWSLNKPEWDKIINKTWFTLEEHSCFYKETNHANWLWKEFIIYDIKWNKLHQKDILPTHQFTTLRKEMKIN